MSAATTTTLYSANISGGPHFAEGVSRAELMAFLIDGIAAWHGGMRHAHAVIAAALLIREAEKHGRACSINGAFAAVVAPSREVAAIEASRADERVLPGRYHAERERLEREMFGAGGAPS